MNSSEREGWYLNDATGLVQWWDGKRWAPPVPAPQVVAPPRSPAPGEYQPVEYLPVETLPVETPPAASQSSGIPLAAPLPAYVSQQSPEPQQFPAPQPFQAQQFPPPSQFHTRQPIPPGYAPARPAGATVLTGNRLSLTAILIAVLYLLLDLVSGALILGIVPIVYSVLAFRRKERLAPVALACAVVVLMVGFALRGH